MKIKEARKITEKRLGGRTVEIWYDPKAVRNEGSVCAACSVLPNNIYKISVDGSFFKLSKNAKSFAINHECGHIVNGDLNDIMFSFDNLIRRIYGFTNKREVAADLYSVKRIGYKNTYKAMLECKIKHPFKYGSYDLIGRIVALMIL